MSGIKTLTISQGKSARGKVSGWRWQIKDKQNGKVTGASSEGYENRAECLANLLDTTGFDAIPLVPAASKAKSFEFEIVFGHRAVIADGTHQP